MKVQISAMVHNPHLGKDYRENICFKHAAIIAQRGDDVDLDVVENSDYDSTCTICEREYWGKQE